MLGRKSLKIRLLSGLCVAAVAISGAPAAADTLEEALAYTYVANPEVRAQRAYLRSIYEKISQSQAGYKPVVSATAKAGYSHEDNDTEFPMTTYEVDNKPYEFGVSAVQPLFSGFETVSAVKQSKRAFEAQKAALRTLEQNVLLQAVSVYTDVIRDTAVLKLRQNNEAVLARELAYARDRFRVGELTKTDVAQAEARYAGAVAARIKAEGDLKVSYASYEKTIGKVPEQIFDPDVPTARIPKTLEEAVATAKENNPSVLQARRVEEQAQAAVSVAQSGFYPNVDLTAGYTNSHNDDAKAKNTSIMVVMNVPLYKAGSTVSKVREAKHLAGRARIDVDTAARDVVRLTTQAFENYSTASASLVSLEEQVRAAALAAEGVKYEEEAGNRTVLDVLNAEQELLNARVDMITAKKNQIVASYTLLAAMGMMTPADLGLDMSPYRKKTDKNAGNEQKEKIIVVGGDKIVKEKND